MATPQYIIDEIARKAEYVAQAESVTPAEATLHALNTVSALDLDHIKMICEVLHVSRAQLINAAIDVLSKIILTSGENPDGYTINSYTLTRGLTKFAAVASAGSAHVLDAYTAVRNRVNAEITEALIIGASYTSAIELAIASVYREVLTNTDGVMEKNIELLYAAFETRGEFFDIIVDQPKTSFHTVSAVVRYVAQLENPL